MNFDAQRVRMVEQQIKVRGVRDENIIAAMLRVPREAFVPIEVRESAYTDRPLPIGCEQMISQPYIVALMTEALALNDDDRVLEIGTGSGYQAAVLSELAGQVCSIERHAALADRATETLQRLGYTNVTVRTGNGSVGCPEEAPFDAIIVTASAPEVPSELLDQLAENGRLVIPVGRGEDDQCLIRIRRTGHNEFLRENLGPVRFVPLIGEAGWHTEPESDTILTNPRVASAPAR